MNGCLASHCDISKVLLEVFDSFNLHCEAAVGFIHFLHLCGPCGSLAAMQESVAMEMVDKG